MAYNSALGAGELTALRLDGHSVRAYLSAHTSTVVESAQFNGAGSTANPYVQLAVTGASAGWTTNVKRNMTVKIISSVYTPNAIYLRARATPASSVVLDVMENSYFDPGLIPIEKFSYSVSPPAANGDTIQVLDRKDLWTHLPRISGANIYEDYDSTGYPTGLNLYPQPIVNMGKHVSTFVDAGQTYATLTFTVNPIYMLLSTAAGSPYAWTIPGSWSVTSGSSSTQSFTAHVPAGEYWLACTITNDSGYSQTGYRKVWVHDYSTHAPIDIAQVSNDTRDLTGRKMKVRVLDGDLANIELGGLVNYWEVATWGGSDVSTATTNFTGFVLSINYVMESGVRYAELNIVGPAEMMKRLGGFSQWIETTSGAPGATAYQQVYVNMSYVDTIIQYMLMLRAPNVLALFDHNPLTPNASYGFPYYKINVGSIYDQIKGLAASMMANYGFDSRGTAWITRHPSNSAYYAAGAGLFAQAKRLTLAPATDITSIHAERQTRPRVRKVRGECFKAGTSPGSPPTTAVVEAPAFTPGQGTGEKTIGGLNLQASSELQEIIGGEYGRENNPWPSVSVGLAGNYDVVEPAIQNPVGLQADADMSPDGVAWDKEGVVTRVSKRVLPNGDVEMDYEMEMLNYYGLGYVVSETF